jgi:hypothetical protein
MDTYIKTAKCNDDLTRCTITYTDILDTVWNRIKTNSLILSHAGIGPQIYNITENPYTITYLYVTPLNNPNYHPTLTKQQLGEKARGMVRYMHDILDIAHCDLSPDNVGYIDEKLYFFDHDESFRISEGITPWTQHLMDLDGCSFQDLVDSDYRRFAKW